MLIDMLLDAQLARAFNHALFLQSFFEFEFLKHTWLARLRVLHPFLHLFAEWIHLASHSQTWQRYAKMPLSMRQILQDSQRMQGSRCDFTTKSLGDHLHLQPGRHSWRTKFIISLTVNILEPSLCHCDTRCHYHATKCLAFPFATWPTISGWSAAPIAKHAKTRQNMSKQLQIRKIAAVDGILPLSPFPSPFPSPFLSPLSPFSPFSPLLLPSPFLLPFSVPFLWNHKGGFEATKVLK